MFVSTCKGGAKGKYTYVRLMESYRDENGKVKHKVVQNLGRLDLLEQKEPNYLENLKQKYREKFEEKKHLQSENRIAQAKSILDFDKESANTSPLPLLQYGHYALKKIWDDYLHLDRKFHDIKTRQTNARFDLNAVVSYLCFLKILDPHSIFYSFGDQDGFLGTPVQNIALDSFYDSYDYLFEHKDSIMRFFGRSVNKQLGKTKATLIYYDVTNVYFETALTDMECGRRQKDFEEKLQEEVEQARANGELDDSCFNEEGGLVLCDKSQEFIEKIENKKLEYLRMRGPSKEHRFDLPLASIALVINEEGIPIDFYVYAGNASEFKTMSTSIGSLKKKYDVKESIVVADRGLNSASNLKMLLENDLGFLMAQKVSNLDQATTKAMFDPQGYMPITSNGEEVGRYKVIDRWVKKAPKKEDDVTCTLVLTFDEKRQKRDLAVLEVWKQLVLKKQSQGVKVKPKKSGWASIAKTCENVEADILGIDEEAFAAKQRLAGYAALVYKNAPDCQGQDTVSQSHLASAYHELTQIENCFRIMKSNLGLRPMYVRNSNHIKGHVPVCVLALGILKLLQWKLKQERTPISVNQIIRALNSATTVPLKNGENLMLLQCSRPKNYRKGRERLSSEELKKVVQKELGQPSELEKIFKSVEITTPGRLATLSEMGRCLGVRFSSAEEAIPELVRQQL